MQTALISIISKTLTVAAAIYVREQLSLYTA